MSVDISDFEDDVTSLKKKTMGLEAGLIRIRVTEVR
jgi:hypothetical protein